MIDPHTSFTFAGRQPDDPLLFRQGSLQGIVNRGEHLAGAPEAHLGFIGADVYVHIPARQSDAQDCFDVPSARQ